jgi:hypothetical protein
MRAIDVSGTSIHLISQEKTKSHRLEGSLRQDYRATFPLPPQSIQDFLGPDFCPESMTISFNTLDFKPDRKLPDPNVTPVSIPVTIWAPYYYPDSNRRSPFSTRQEIPVSSDKTIGSFLDGLFSSVAMYSRIPVNSMPSAVAHDRDPVVALMSSRGRLFEIPRETTIKDVAGVRWPRPSDCLIVKNLRRTPAM